VNELAAHLDALPEAAFRAQIRKCCGCDAWVEGMVRERPFRTDRHVFESADTVWHALAKKDWLEAFSAHPRIGERPGANHASTASWSQSEQSGMDTAAASVTEAIAEGNRAYEKKFGHVFLICATGKTADEMLASLRERLTHDAETEVRIAAREHALITRIRLKKLVHPS